jgi:uncharacterized protein YndB with AHSA1/START domain
MTNEKSNTADRELVFTRLLDAPIELVWDVWTKPEHIKQWWGPDGYNTTVAKMDVRPGGEWELTILNPDDPLDHHHLCNFIEVVKHKKIVYEQHTDFIYTATVEFESLGDKTFLTWRMLFETKEYMEHVAESLGVRVSLQQTGEKLENYLSQYRLITG